VVTDGTKRSLCSSNESRLQPELVACYRRLDKKRVVQVVRRSIQLGLERRVKQTVIDNKLVITD